MSRIESISNFIDSELERLADKVDSLGKPIHGYTLLNDFFLAILDSGE